MNTQAQHRDDEAPKALIDLAADQEITHLSGAARAVIGESSPFATSPKS